MCLIMTKLRNRMNVVTLDALMQIASNAPPMHDLKAVAALVQKAISHWLASCKRNVRKSHPGVAGRKSKTTDHSLQSALNELSSVHRDRCAKLSDLPLFVREVRGEVEPPTSTAPAQAGPEQSALGPAPTQAELFAAIPPFAPKDGQRVLPAPRRADWERNVSHILSHVASPLSHLAASNPLSRSLTQSHLLCNRQRT
jgi:hypothetical protein